MPKNALIDVEFRKRLRLFWASDAGRSAVVAILWQLFMTVIGVVFAYFYDQSSVAKGLTSHLSHWDSGWYLHVIAHQYDLAGSAAAPAFYPLFPLLVGGLSWIAFGILSPLAASYIVNTLAVWLIILAFIKILRHFPLTRHGRLYALASLLAFPSAFYLHVFYGEAVFMAVGLWAYLFALEKQWARMGLLLAIITASRLPSVLFVALCGLEYLRANKWSIRKSLNPNALWFALAPVGFVAYGTYLYIVRHDFWAMFHAYSATDDWIYHKFSPNIFQTVYTTVQNILEPLLNGRTPSYGLFINQFLPLLALLGIVTASLYCLIRLKKHIGVPLALFGLLSSILFTLNSNVVSAHRYALPVLTIYIALGLFYTRKPKLSIVLWVLLGLSFVLQLYLYWLFTHDIFTG